MKNIYKLVNLETSGGLVEILLMTSADGTVSTVPMVAGNADYEAYLNPVEHLTEIIPATE